MNCTVIQPDATYNWDPETGSGSWSGPNTCTLRATDSVTGEEEQLDVPFQPQLIDASNAVSTVVGPQGTDFTPEQRAAYGQHFNNMLWACAVALDRWPTSNIVAVDGVVQAQVDGSEVAVISNDDEQVHPIG